MIRFVQHQEIDFKKWDNCIEQSFTGEIFSCSWYLNVCAPGWCALVEDDYVSVFPLAYRSKMGIRYVYQPYFTRHFGVTSLKENNSQLRLEFLKAIPAHFRYLDFCLNRYHTEGLPGMQLSERRFQQLDLGNTYDHIASQYSENMNRTLRKAEKVRYSILPDYNPDFVVEQFRILKRGASLAFDEGDYKVLRELMKAVNKNAVSKCWAAVSKEGEVIAAAFFMQFQNRVVYLKGFSNPEGRNQGAMHFIFDRLIRSFAGTPLYLDFGGSDVEGVARFFKGFGAVDSIYLQLRQNRLPGIIRWLKS
jgi:hypothetical protein